ncbi:TIGR02450 family Trp-rich protein [Salinisphaera sp.]|uniref:TIGR02450 family Trp-rich protein n=1 Tax=Salinisphaera sp. TaxID=1914330 RepID=UPI000C5846E1|nr:TIGR02450 family Trp-rich protein [Salinisphaera sp.]MBS61494.1 TIGR02450 family Trp-rich protein [Salinisphaera sp.]
MNRINPNKLLHSKWTAAAPENGEKHFLVVDLLRDDNDNVVQVVLEAVLTRRRITQPWRRLNNEQTWRFGWQ